MVKKTDIKLRDSAFPLQGRDQGFTQLGAHIFDSKLYRAICNLTRADDFGDLRREISPPVIERLRRTYEHVDDIDFFTGGLAETPLHGGLVGPTFACVIGIQFREETQSTLWFWAHFWANLGDSSTHFIFPYVPFNQR